VPPAGYPADLESEVLLADGRVAVIRPIVPDDAAELIAFAGKLSGETVYLRFFSPRRTLTEEEAARLATVDYTDRLALVAFVDGELAAVARYERLAQADQAEVAFTVRDDQQGRGLGTVLLEHLAAAALARGIVTFVADTLPENVKMLGVFRAAGLVEQARYDNGLIRVTMQLEPVPGYLERVEERDTAAAVRSLRPLLEPASVAVVGASPRPGTVGHQLVANLLRAGYRGAIYPVHPRAPAVLGIRAFPSAAELPGPVDLAVIAVPAAAVTKVVRELGEVGCRGIVVVSAGFAELGPDGAAAERELVAVARRHGMRLVGPNCLGVVNTAEDVRLDATFAPVAPVPGRLAFCSQSGGLGVAILAEVERRGLGISCFVSVGNKADVSSNDLIRYFEQDPGTDVILLYLESFGNPRHFSRIARRVSRTRPIVAVKAGRSVSGSRGASAQTAGRHVPDDVVDALFQQAGVIRVDTLEELFDVAEVLSHQPLPAGNRVAVLANASGPGVLAADACEARGLAVPLLQAETAGRLREVLAPEAGVHNPVDCHPTATVVQYRTALSILLEAPEVDAVIAIFTPPLGTDAEEVAAAVAACAATSTKPVLANFLASGGTLEALRATPRPVPWFAYPESAARALAKVVPYAAWRRRAERAELGGGEPDPAAAGIVGDLGAARAVVAGALARAEPDGEAGAGAWLDPEECRRLLAAYGVAAGPVPERSRPLATEVRIGLHEDSSFGPVVTFGLSGMASTVFGDRAVRLAPLSTEEAREMIRSIKAAPVLEGGGGRLPTDVDALAALLAVVARMAEDLPELAELELDPVLAPPGGDVVVLAAKAQVLAVAPEPLRWRRRLR
jgi:acetyl coenzyme A synthetase (ADP forming)-like protein